MNTVDLPLITPRQFYACARVWAALERAWRTAPDTCCEVKTVRGNGRPTATWRWDERKESSNMARLVLQLRLGRRLQTGEVARHRCDNMRCINPHHIVVGSQQDNVLDYQSQQYARLKDPDVVKMIHDLRERGMKQQDIALKMGLSQASVSNVLRGVKYCVGTRSRSTASNREIWELRQQGWTQQRIADHVGLSQSSVFRILRVEHEIHRNVPTEPVITA